MALAEGKVLLHLAGRRRRVVDADDIYYLDAQGDEAYPVSPGTPAASPDGRPTDEPSGSDQEALSSAS